MPPHEFVARVGKNHLGCVFFRGGLVIAELPDPLLLEAEHGLSLVEEILQLGGEFTGKFH